MKKIIFSLLCLLGAVSTNAQIVEVYKNGVLDTTYVNSSTAVFKFVAKAINLLPGKFSVSATKKVQFTKSNLYWDGNSYHLEANQTDYPTSWNANHVGHFFWTNLKDYRSENSSYMPYTEEYNCSGQSKTDKFWCSKYNKLTVDGTDGLYALTGDDEGEWYYLIHQRTNARKLYKYGVTITKNGINYANCLIIAPDDFAGTLQSNYTLEEVNDAGLVCLPAAGGRIGSSLNYGGSWGSYWSATPVSNRDDVYEIFFNSSSLVVDDSDNYDERNSGQSIRLVRDI